MAAYVSHCSECVYTIYNEMQHICADNNTEITAEDDIFQQQTIVIPVHHNHKYLQQL